MPQRMPISPEARSETLLKASVANPLLITLRLIAGLPSLRRGAAFRVLEEVLAAARDLNGMRIVHFDILGNVISGPPPRPLDEFVTKIEGGELFVQLPPIKRES